MTKEWRLGMTKEWRLGMTKEWRLGMTKEWRLGMTKEWKLGDDLSAGYKRFRSDAGVHAWRTPVITRR